MPGLFQKKPNGVITSVRYADDGQRLSLIRFYERRGAIYSDLQMIARPDLIERLKSGQKLVIGQRQGNVPGSFQTGKAVRLAGAGEGARICTGETGEARDYLEGAPIF